MKKLSIVVPCHNEEATLPRLIQRLTSVAQSSAPNDFEIVLVDDGSRDNTWREIKSHAAVNAEILGIKLSRNFGHQNALTAGLREAQGELILIIDADLQDPPELLPEMIATISSGADIIYGKRRSREGETRFKLHTAKWFYRVMNWFSDTEIPADTGDFRLMNRKALNAYLSMPEYHRFVRGMIAWVGFKQIAIEYDRAPREAGDTSYSLTKMIKLAADALTSFSIAPLRICGFIGLISVLISFGLLGYVLFSYFILGSVRGWASIAAVITFFGSVQLISLSVIGEYLGRLFLEAKRRPQYLIEDKANITLQKTQRTR